MVEMVHDLGDVELQRAILSSMEMPSDKNEGSLILERYRNCVHEAHLTLPRLSVILDSLTYRCFATLQKSQSKAHCQQRFKKTYLKSVIALWNSLQRLHSVGFDVFYTQDEQKALLKALLRNPRQYKYCLPGVTHCALSSTASIPGILLGVLRSFEEDGKNDFNVYFHYLREIIEGDVEVAS
jgi:hypothetical protein